MGRFAVVLAVAFVTACGASAVKVRRPLVTDKTPLGTKAGLVECWFAAHGWCVDKRDEDRVRARLCDPTAPVLFTVLTFRDGVLVQADVAVPVGPAQQGALMPYPSVSSPGPHQLRSRSGDDANGLLDALAFELETRYGTPVDSGGHEPRLTWVTGQERIVLYLERGRRWIVERHTRVADPEAPARPWLKETW